MKFENQGIKLYDVSFYQTVIFEYVSGERIMLPPEKQKHIDFAQMKTKASATILKCGQRDYKDPAFDVGWKNAKEAGIPRGSYWFCDKFDTPKNQAKLYWSYLKDDLGEGVHAADFETGSWNDLDSLYQFINEFQQLSGLSNEKIVIYTGYYFFIGARENASRKWFSQYPLWIASYSSNLNYVKIPPEWEEPLIWQYGTPSNENCGVHSKEVDANWFNGSKEKFEKYFGKDLDSVPLPIKDKRKVVLINGKSKLEYEEK